MKGLLPAVYVIGLCHETPLVAVGDVLNDPVTTLELHQSIPDLSLAFALPVEVEVCDRGLQLHPLLAVW